MVALIGAFLVNSLHGADSKPIDPGVVEQKLKQAVRFFDEEVSVNGTYLWAYSEDLNQREGEGVVESRQRGWLQPPGTPAVGMAVLKAWEATGDDFYLYVAHKTGKGLLSAQLESGGWYYYVDFDPEERNRLHYRHQGNPKGRNVTTLDDDVTQSVLRFMMRLDSALEIPDPDIHEAVEYAWTRLFQAQYPNGAWPQGYQAFPDPEDFPVMEASYPDSWPREWPGSKQYWFKYTLNDNVLANMVDTLFEAATIYKDAPSSGHLVEGCLKAAKRSGDFLTLAQMPAPQPAWAQQYDFEMHPSWARKFEPPAVTGGESRGAIQTLMDIYLETGDSKYLDPIPQALEYLKRSKLEDGRVARFYELKTNKPLYFTRDYQLTYDDSDMPTHYAFKVSGNFVGSMERRYERLAGKPWEKDEGGKDAADDSKDPLELADSVRRVLDALDERGRWVEPGGLRYHRPKDPSVNVIRCSTFNRNVELLSDYLTATKRRR